MHRATAEELARTVVREGSWNGMSRRPLAVLVRFGAGASSTLSRAGAGSATLGIRLNTDDPADRLSV